MSTDWKAEEKRWSKGINLTMATKDDITSFITYRLWEYEREEPILSDTEL